MPVTVLEKWDSRDTTLAESSSVELRFLVTGTDDDAQVAAGVLGNSPGTYNGMPRESVTFSRIGELEWDAVVRYATKPATDTEPSFTFETGGGTAHITQALSTSGVYVPAGMTAPDFKNAIGVSRDSVDGVDIVVPTYKWTETFRFPAAFVTGAYKATLFGLTGRVNSVAFRSFQAEEVLFEGARGSRRGTGDWEISFSFAASPNVNGLTIGNITGISKKGWEYLWCRYADFEDVAAQMLVKRPVAVIVNRVYPSGTFSLLGIGS
jgi:hypothetical protein